MSSDQGYAGELGALCNAEINVREGGREGGEGRGGVGVGWMGGCGWVGR